MDDYLPCRIFCFTSDKYRPALLTYAYLLNKYWQPNPQVVVVGFTPPDFYLPENFTFCSVGQQRDYPFDRWSNAVIKFLQSVEDTAFVLMLEDYWITRAVDARAVHILYDYIIQFGYVARIDLTGDRLYAGGVQPYGVVSYLDLIRSDNYSAYHLSLMTGIWRREHLLSVLIPNESPHAVELEGTSRLAARDDLLVLGVKSWPVKHTLGLRGGDSSKIDLSELSEQDVREIRSRGYLTAWE